MTYNITKPGLPPYSTVTSEAEAIADCEEANRIICPGHEIYRESDGAYMVEDSTGGLCEYVRQYLPHRQGSAALAAQRLAIFGSPFASRDQFVLAGVIGRITV